jgi:septal ring factor EnvC (AmiA/AmiB activator)
VERLEKKHVIDPYSLNAAACGWCSALKGLPHDDNCLWRLAGEAAQTLARREQAWIVAITQKESFERDLEESQQEIERLEREQAEAQHETSLVRAFFADASPKSQAAMERHIAEVKGLRLQLTACQRERDEALEARDREGKIRDAAVTLQDALLEKNRELRAALADAQRRGPA